MTFIEVATAQNEELARQRELVQVQGEQLVTAVALVKSVGGDWNAEKLAAKK